MRKGLTIGKIRSALYKTAKLLGDINAVKRGSVGQRVSNRLVGKASGRISGKFVKKLDD